jgi:hypothetical protein
MKEEEKIKKENEELIQIEIKKKELINSLNKENKRINFIQNKIRKRITFKKEKKRKEEDIKIVLKEIMIVKLIYFFF